MSLELSGAFKDLVSQPPPGGPRDSSDPIAMHAAVAEAVLADADLGATLETIARYANELLGTNRCSVFLRDDDRSSGCFRGYAAHALAGRDAVPKMVCGGDADRLTPEIVATRRPIFVRDAPHDGRPVRSAMLRHNVRDILGVPMVLGGEVIGLLFVDHAGEPGAFSEEQQARAAVFANLCAITVSQVQRVAGLETTVGTLKRNVAALRRGAAIEVRFAELAETGADPQQVIALLEALTGLPCGLYTTEFERIARVTPAGMTLKGDFLLEARTASDTTVALELENLRPGNSGIIGPHLHCNLHNRSIVSPVTVDGARWGYVAVVEQGRRLTTADKAAVERAAHTLTIELRTRRGGVAALAAGPGDQSATELNVVTLNRELALHGGSRDVPRLVCMIQREDGRPWAHGDPSVLEATFDRLYGSVHTIALADGNLGIGLVVEQDEYDTQETFVDRTRVAIHATIEHHGPGELVGVISSVAHEIDDLARAYTECRQLMRCMTELCPPGTPPLAANDLGVGRLLLGTSDGPAMNRFVRSALGPLLVDDPKFRALLTTLHVFLESSRSPRVAGRALDVHENTIRYRLTKASELTGLDVSGDLNDQLTAQVALLILRLQGRLPGVDVFGRLEAQEDVAPVGALPVGADDRDCAQA